MTARAEGATIRFVDDARWHLVAIVVLLVPLYVVNARWGLEGNSDAIAAALPAYQVVNEQTLDLSQYAVITDNLDELGIWYVETEKGQVVSNRAPGLIALAIPSYAAIQQEGFSNGPATLVALITTLLAVIITWRVLIPVAGLNTATVAAITLGLGTTTWWVSSSELWPHGPGQLWAALAVASLASARIASSGIAFGLAVVTRPITAIFGTVVAVLESLRTREFARVVKIGFGTALGVAAVLLYNRYVFGGWSLSGGYGTDFTTGAVERFAPLGYLKNVWGMFMGWPNGFLTTTPIIGIAVVGAAMAWRKMPGWAKSLAWAALAYLLVHAALNRASGGSAVFYRYPLEPIVLAAPVLVLGARHLWDRSNLMKRLIVAGIAISIALQFVHVFIISCWITDPPISMCLLA